VGRHLRIGLNLLHARPEIGGGWNYIQSLIAALGEHDPNNTYIAFVNELSQQLVPHKSHFHVVTARPRVDILRQPVRVLYENTWLHVHTRQYALDLMHWFANTQALIKSVPSCVTCYDMKVFHEPETHAFFKRHFLLNVIAYTAKRADILFPMSLATAQEMAELFSLDIGAMEVIPTIIDTEFGPRRPEDVASFRNKYNLPKDFWLYVAHTYPHKNHSQLLRAYATLLSGGIPTWPLILRGDPGGAALEVEQLIHTLKLENSVFRLPRLEDSEMPLLYSAASALVFPSTYEGGGIPVLEAMACGCPVLASPLPVLMEHGGHAIAYFQDLQISSIAHAMQELEADEGLRRSLVDAGIKRAEEFRATRIVGRVLRGYERAVAKPLHSGQE
jgi:glycosyltransferase involved in cell wall biosynthesis